ncbi:MAG: peptidylprolyl isomerase [Saprospiraceae bacterium]
MHKVKYLLLQLICCLYCLSCLPPVQEDLNNVNYSKQDPIYRRLKDFQDRRLSDSLYNYLDNPKAMYRLIATEAFGSYRDTNAIIKLIEKLNDPNEFVKQAAAYSLGQIGSADAEAALIKAFIAVDSSGPYIQTNAMILEALGKCGSDSTLNLICKIQNYKTANSILLEGQLLCIYRFGLRNKFCNQSVPLLVDIAVSKNYSDRARLIAVSCLQRFKNIDFKPRYKEIRNACFEEKNSNIRMGLIYSLSKIGSEESYRDLEELYTRILDQRVQCSLIKGLQNYPRGMASALAMKALQNPSLHIASLAAQYFNEKADESDESELVKLIYKDNLHWECKSQIYSALLSIVPEYKKIVRTALLDNLIADINKAKDPYEKSAYIKVLQNSPLFLNYLLQLANKEQEPIITTTLVSTISQMFKNPSFTLLYKGSHNFIYTKTTNYLNQVCKKHDVGGLAVMAEWFRTDKGLIAKYFRPDSSLSEAKNGLKLPRDIETYNEIENTLTKLKGVKFQEKKTEYNHPINWQRIDNLSDTIHAEINTSKGKIEIELYPKQAPGSVINFLELIDQNFFTDKIIHRVVPNFVIQSGCPRGDGYGSLDYNIRTETNMTFNFETEAMIGMASAGLDTECSQFFITYSPTLHLDGKYSIFGRMTKGIDILSLINQGDKILGISLK